MSAELHERAARLVADLDWCDFKTVPVRDGWANSWMREAAAILRELSRFPVVACRDSEVKGTNEK